MLLTMIQIQLLAQESNNTVALNIPVRNSLMFNRHLINPTFSFVREQHKYASIYNKREFVQFNDAPLTYLASYSGRFGENVGAGLSLFQKSFGIFTSFGGVLNLAYNTRLRNENNLTFGLNLGVFNNGLETETIVANFQDPLLGNVPNSLMLTINPGINFGTVFLDFGVSINNLVLYNFESSTLETENPEQGIQGHIMYTGYISSRGFFDDSKFSGLIRTEVRRNETIFAGNAMLTIPKGLWVQVGYNTAFGGSGGLGINVTREIALEYNYEMAFGDVNPFGPSHEITLAYRFKSKKYYDYSRQDEVAGLLSENKPKYVKTFRYNTKTKNTETPLETITEDVVSAPKDSISIAMEPKIAKVTSQRDSIGLSAKISQERVIKKDSASKPPVILKESIIQTEITKILDSTKFADTSEKKMAIIDSVSTKDDKLQNKEANEIMASLEETEIQQKELLEQYSNTIESKNETLSNMKEDNDLSEKGLAPKPRVFKSITAENNTLARLKLELDSVTERRSRNIQKLTQLYEDLYEADTIYNELVIVNVKKTLNELKTKQAEAKLMNTQLESRLEAINLAIEFEKRRRIKRAEFDNEKERYEQGRERLKYLKESTDLEVTKYKIEDFNFGAQATNNIQILKNVNYTESGYYIVLAIHDDVKDRDDFIKKVIASGESEVDFFYDVNTGKYYIYINTYLSIQNANNQMNNKGTEPYKNKLSIVKIEN